MSGKVTKAISALQDIGPIDLDGCGTMELAQFMYWLQRHQGSIFVRAMGRVAHQHERREQATATTAAAPDARP